MEKEKLRKLIAQELKALSDADRLWADNETCRLICEHELVKGASVVVAFWPLPDEVDIRSAVRKLHEKEKVVLLPHVISDSEMELCLYDGDSSLHPGAYGIMEPTLKAMHKLTSIDVILVPGRAFDKDGNRLGRGKGYYDRFLAENFNVPTVGICYPSQIVDYVPNDKNDIKIKEILWKISK